MLGEIMIVLVWNRVKQFYTYVTTHGHKKALVGNWKVIYAIFAICDPSFLQDRRWNTEKTLTALDP